MGELESDEQGVDRVLLVEDTYAAARLFQLAFEEVDSDIDIDVVPSGEAALEYLLEDSEREPPLPDLVLLDLDLEDLYGTDVLREIRASDVTATLPVVVFSSNRDQEVIDQCYALGANTYIVKPDDYAGLVDVAITIRSYWSDAPVALPSR